MTWITLAMVSALGSVTPMRLWSGPAPLSRGFSDVDVPTLTRYAPEKPNGQSIVICPGGAYWTLAPHEGKDYAEFLAMHGINAFVLKYRLGSHQYRHPAMLIDAKRAIQTVRFHAKDWKLDPRRVGIMGSSAGGHLAASASVLYNLKTPTIGDTVDRISPRPDFTILCYPVISMSPPVGHDYSRKMLLGDEPSAEMVQLLSPALQVNSKTPPAFVWHTLEDTGVPPENSKLYAEALRAAGVPYDIWLYQKGEHGIGLNDRAPYTNVHPWATRLLEWLKTR